MLISDSAPKVTKARQRIALLLRDLLLLAGLEGCAETEQQISSGLKSNANNKTILDYMLSEERCKVLRFSEYMKFADEPKEESVEEFEARLTRQQQELYGSIMEMFGFGPPTFIDLENPQWYLVFTEAVNAMIDAQPKLVQSSKELGQLYSKSNYIGATYAKSMETVEVLRETVQAYIAGDIRRAEAIEQIAQAENWSEHYALTCLRTNTARAYALGNVTQFKTNLDLVAGWKLKTMNDADVRPNHQAVDGLVADEEWHKEHAGYFAPLGFNCRCENRIVTKAEAEREGWLDKENKLIPQLPTGWELNGAEDKEKFGHYIG